MSQLAKSSNTNQQKRLLSYRDPVYRVGKKDLAAALALPGSQPAPMLWRRGSATIQVTIYIDMNSMHDAGFSSASI